MRTVVWWLALGACGGDDASPLPEDTDVDADTDADADADTDSDADTDTPLEPADLAGCTAIVETDEGDDNSVEVTRTVTYDAGAFVAVVLTDEKGQPARLETDNDAAGRIVEWRVDFEDDGKVDQVWTRVLDDTVSDGLDGGPGDVTSFCQDTDVDGQCDTEERMTHDAVTGLRSLYERDGDGDGVFETQCTYTYDGSDRRSSYDCTGGITQAATYEYGGGPLDYVVSVDAGSDGSVNSRSERRYDAAQRLVFTASDGTADGVWDSEAATTFRTDGTVDFIAGEVRQPANAAAVFREEFSYDAGGFTEQALLGFDVTGDGQPDFLTRRTWSWTCP